MIRAIRGGIVVAAAFVSISAAAGGGGVSRAADKEKEGTAATMKVSEWVGCDSKISKPRYLRITTGEQWRELWKEHSQAAPPEVDFNRHMVVAIFTGNWENSRGVRADFREEEKRITVRYVQDGYGSCNGADHVTPYGLFVIPRSSKEVVIEENTESLKGAAPVWTERARFKSSEEKPGLDADR